MNDKEITYERIMDEVRLANFSYDVEDKIGDMVFSALNHCTKPSKEKPRAELSVKIGGTMRKITEFVLPNNNHSYELTGIQIGDLRLFADEADITFSLKNDFEHEERKKKANSGFITPK